MFDPTINPITRIRPVTRNGNDLILDDELTDEQQAVLIANLTRRGTWQYIRGTGVTRTGKHGYNRDHPGEYPGYNGLIADYLPEQGCWGYFLVWIAGDPFATINYSCGHIGPAAVRDDAHEATLTAGLCGHCTNKTANPVQWQADEAVTVAMIEQARIALTGTPEERAAANPPRYWYDDEFGELVQVGGAHDGPPSADAPGDSFDGDPL